MPILTRSASPLALTALLAFSGSLSAAPQPAKLPDPKTSAKKYRPAEKFKMSAAELNAEIERRRQVLDRTKNVFTLLGAEMALNKGDIATAIGVYLTILRESRDPDVAERAMELAINARAYTVAEQIYRQWREIEPNPGPAQRRLAWVRALANGDTNTMLRDLDFILTEADDTQKRRVFLLLAQMSVVHPKFIDSGADAVHRAAQRYDDLPEAMIADVLYNTGKGREDRALDALQKLAAADGDINAATLLALKIVGDKNPELLARFFRRHDSRKMSEAWREIEINSLIRSEQYDEAYARLEQLIGQTPNAALYIQAAAISISRQDNINTALNHLERAYQTGTAEQKSRAAMIAAMRLSADKRYADAERWLARVTAPEYRFDQTALRVSLAAEQKQWKQVRTLAETAQKLPTQRGIYFNKADIENLNLYAVAQELTPQRALAEFTRLLAQAERRRGPEYNEYAASILYQRGLLYANRLKQPEKAIADFRRYLKLLPDNTAGQNALGYTLLTLGTPAQRNEAFRLIQAAYQKDPENLQINDSMGWAYFKTGDAEAALPYLEFAYDKEADPEVAAHLGEVYWSLGRQDQARSVWQKAWQADKQHDVLNETLKRFGIVFH